MIADVRSGTIATGTKTMEVIPTAIEASTTNGSPRDPGSTAVDLNEEDHAVQRPSSDVGNVVFSGVLTLGPDRDIGHPGCAADREDFKMPKDTKKMARARSRSQMSIKKEKAAATVKAVRRAANDVLTERQTKRRSLRQKAQAGR